MNASCVSTDEMRGFLAGDLAPDEEAAIAGHLEGCSQCERLAARLSDDDLARELHAGGRRRTDPREPIEIDDLCRRLHALGFYEMALRSERARAEATGTVDAEPKATAASGDTTEDRSAWTSEIIQEEDRGGARPTQLGPYKIERALGAGTFGIVYLAEDSRVQRRVAIKVARASVLADPGLRIRFFREAQALARLEHPHIVPVYEADEIDGLCFLVLAYCDGQSLDDWLRDRGEPLDPISAVRLMLPLVEAVEHAHSRGILHRDIKPGNMLLQRGNAGDELPVLPKLTDFGLAKVIEEKETETLAGVVLGTASYMAPEQAAGHLERIGPATDVYAVGAVLYQLLTGRVPIEGNSTVDTLRRLLIDEPLDVGRVVANCPDDLNAIVMKCLQKSPAQRYATAKDLAADLQNFLAGLPTLARPLRTDERVSRWLGKHKAVTPLLALALTAIGLSLGLFYYADRLSRSQFEVQRAVEQLGRAHQWAESRELLLAQQAYASDLFAAGKSTAQGDISQAVEALQRQFPQSNRPDLRGIEWHYLWATNTHQPRVYCRAGTPVYHMGLSPDGKELAAVGSDGLLRLYDAAELTLRVAIPTGQIETNGVAYSPSGRLAATAGDDGTIRIFDLATRRERRVIRAHPDKAFGVVFCGGEDRLASCGNDPVVRLWNAETGEALQTLEGHSGAVESIAISPGGEYLVTGSADASAILWDLRRGVVRRTLVGHRDAITSVCFSPDGRWIATGALDHAVSIWDARSGRRLGGENHLDKIQSVAFASDGSRLYAGDRTGSVHQYRIVPRSASERRVRLESDPADEAWHAHSARVWCVMAGTAPGTFYTAGGDTLVRRWDQAALNQAEQSLPGAPDDPLIDIDYSADGKLLFVLHESSGVSVLDAASLRPCASLHARHSGWRSLRVLADRDEVAAGNGEGIVVIWNYRTGELRQILAAAGAGGAIGDLAYSAKSGFLAVLPDDVDEVRIYDPRTAALVARLPTVNHTAFALAPDGYHLAVDSLNAITIFDLRTHRQLRQASGHTSTIYAIAYSPDGRLLASGSDDRTVRLWSADGTPVAKLTGHLTDVVDVAFTPDGRTLLSVDDGGVIAVTHVSTRQSLFDLPLSAERLRSLTIAPHSRRMAMIRTLRGAQDVLLIGGPPPQ